MTKQSHILALLDTMTRHHGHKAPSGGEGPFLDYLEAVFSQIIGADRVHRCLSLSDYLYIEGNGDLLLLAHVDRVYTNRRGDPVGVVRSRQKGGRIIGQLDNVISTATIEMLVRSGGRPHIIFVTNEEVSRSDDSYRAFLQDFPDAEELTLVVMDIDVAFGHEREVVKGGMVSLRSFDTYARYDASVVAWAREVAEQESVSFHHLDGVWAVGDLTVLTKAGLAKGAFLGIPVTNYHTAAESTTAEAAYGFFRLAAALCAGSRCATKSS